MPGRTLNRTALATICVGSVTVLSVVLLLLPSAIHAAPDLRALPATLQAAQFELHTLDGVPWYFCH